MTDRELLELAAKATGLAIEFRIAATEQIGTRKAVVTAWHGPFIEGTDAEWNPLDNDGDALRLAVKLNLNVFQTGSKAYALPQDDTGDEVGTYHGSDPYAATRRAIVRAAAEIGAMQ